MFPIKRTVFLCAVTLVKNTVHLIGNIEYLTNQPKNPITKQENNTKPTGTHWMNKKPNTKTLLSEENL